MSGQNLRVDASTALTRYLGMGPGRSLSRLHRELTESGVSVSADTIKRWSSKHEWQTHVQAFESRQHQIEGERLESLAHGWDRTESMNERHAALGAELQRLAAVWAGRLAEEGHPMTPAEVAKWAEAGVRIERLAVGAATARTEVIGPAAWNAVIVPILTIFQNVTADLPPDVRNQIAAPFADEVNALRDGVASEQ